MSGLTDIRERIRAAQRRCGRLNEPVELVAVSKVQTDVRVAAVLDAGHRVFGENRVQEAHERWTKFRQAYSEIRLHLIGPLQTNKVKQAIALFDVIETLDREKLARKIADEIEIQGKCPDFYIQVNTGNEEQKSGIAVDDLEQFFKKCVETYQLPVIGLMAIPPVDEPPAPHFALLAKLAERVGVKKLSMGMSADFETAIELGASSVRVGSAIFGARPA